MKKILTLIITILCLAPTFADEAIYNDLYYSIDLIARTAEVAENPRVGANAKEGFTLAIPAEIIVGQKTYRVIGIADNAFKGCKNLTEVVLPETMEYMSRSAFEGTGLWLNKENWKDGEIGRAHV